MQNFGLSRERIRQIKTEALRKTAHQFEVPSCLRITPKRQIEQSRDVPGLRFPPMASPFLMA